MTIRAFLLGGRGGGGEEVFVRDLATTPPEGVDYSLALEPHESVPGARALRGRAALFNRVVHPMLWPLMGLRAYRVSDGFDIVHVHNFPTWLKLPPGCPVVYSLGGSSYAHYLEAYLGWSVERVRKRYARARRVYGVLGIRNEFVSSQRIDAIVVFSRFAADYLLRGGVAADRIHVIPPGMCVEAPAGGPPDHGPTTFLLVGRDPHRKGADVAVAAIEVLRSQGRDVQLVLVGDAAYPGLSRPGVEGHAAVSRERLFREFYPRAHAVLVPSRAEGYGFAAVEGMGHGVPVIVSRRDALPEIVGDAGLLVEPGDVPDLVRAMRELEGDPAQARERGAAGRTRFEAELTRDCARERLGALYRQLLGGT